MSTKVLGAYTASSGTKCLHDLGTRYTDRNGTMWLYVKNDSNAKTAYKVYQITPAFLVTAALTYSASVNCFRVGVCQKDVAANEYFWIAIQGPMTVNVLQNAVQYGQLYSSGTPGSVDDTSSSQLRVHGLSPNALVGGSPADTACYAVCELFVGP